MPLSELMSVRIRTGTLTGIAASKAPVARTVITAEDIRLTPARSIMDLLEVYVPGATFVNHNNGPRFGFRGVLGDQNYHYLLLLNGKKVNFRTQDGALVEIFNRDLGDIREIEIIRGPGSVTYGSGAIGGVINIVTYDAHTADGGRAGLTVDGVYRYQTASASRVFEGDRYRGYVYGSFSRSDGEKNTEWFYVDRAHGYGYGFMSEGWGNKGLGSEPPNYLADFSGEPQIKLHMDLRFLNDWHVWGRYSSFSWERLTEKSVYADGEKFQGTITRSTVWELEKHQDLPGDFSVDASAGFTGISFRDVAAFQGSRQPQNHITQYRNSFSENTVDADLTFHFTPGENYRFALGGIFSHTFWEPEWGKGRDTFLMSMQAPIRFAVYSDDSIFYQTYGEDVSTVVPDLESNAWSVLGEANLALHHLCHLVVSGRADKNDYSRWYYSPRVAVITALTENDILRTVWQRSVRIPNFPELYTMDYVRQSPPDPETLVNYELMYEHNFGQLSVNANLYYNILDEVSWTESGGAEVVGTLKLCGVETGLFYRKDPDTLGANYAYVHQVDYDPKIEIATDLTNPDGGSMPVSGYADNRINNLPSHLMKVFWHHRWTDTVTSHVNARLSLDPNQRDLLDLFKDAHDRYGTEDSVEEMHAIYRSLTGYGYGEPSFTLNASVSLKLPFRPDTKLTVYGMNLITWNHVRYNIQFYEELSRQYPRQASFIREPAAIGMKLEMKF